MLLFPTRDAVLNTANKFMYITDGDDDDDDDTTGCYMCRESVDPSYLLLVKGSGYGHVAQGHGGSSFLGSYLTIEPLWKKLLDRTM